MYHANFCWNGNYAICWRNDVAKTDIQNMIQFTIDKVQKIKLQKWIENQIAKAFTEDVTGFRFTYSFTPTTIGTYIKVFDHVTKEEIDLTDAEWW